MAFLELLLILAGIFLSQLLGGVLTYVFTNRFRKNLRLIVLIESALMLGIAVILLIQGLSIMLYSIFGFLIGIFLFSILNRILPHKHVSKVEEINNLTFSAMCFHEIPEGLAFGASYSINPSLGLLVAVMTMLHTIPESSVISIFHFLKKKYSTGFKAILITSLLYSISSLVSYFLLIDIPVVIHSFFMTFAAGLISFIIYEELVLIKK